MKIYKYENMKILVYPANVVLPCQGIFWKCQEFSVSEQMHLQTFLYGNHPNDALIMKVIDQFMGFCIKITWCKNHAYILFGQCENASPINFFYVGHPNGKP